MMAILPYHELIKLKQKKSFAYDTTWRGGAGHREYVTGMKIVIANVIP